MPTLFHFCVSCEARTSAAQLAPGGLCQDCHRAWTAALAAPAPGRRKPGRPTTLDTCPACGVRQADHWTCAACTSRGHILGRGHIYPELCGWCEAERITRQQRQRAA